MINRLGKNWTEKIGFYRFINNDQVEPEQIIAGIHDQCSTMVESQHYLVLQDTTQPNFEWNRSQIKPDKSLGKIGDGKSLGFFLHPSLVLRAQDEACVGYSDIQHWARPEDKKGKAERKYKSLDIKDKESYRWLKSVNQTKEVLRQASQITVIQDREGDIYELMADTPDERTQLIVRSRDNRNVQDHEGQKGKLFEVLSQAPLLGTYQLPIKGDIRKKRVERLALIEVRATKVTLVAPQRLVKTHKPITLWAIEARESAQSVPQGEKPVLWRLLTTHAAADFEQARAIVYWYSLRWYIETLFRLLKTDGFNIESCELEQGAAIVRMTLFCLHAALRCMCLLLASKQEFNQQSVNELFSKEEIQCLQQLAPKLNGRTLKQSNPYEPKSLKWAFWVIGRLGGWSGLASQHPPGIITLHSGLREFERIFQGWLLAVKDVYKP